MDYREYEVTVTKTVTFTQVVKVSALSMRQAETLAKDCADESNAQTVTGQWRVVRKGDK